jgi:hypothetical protein
MYPFAPQPLIAPALKKQGQEPNSPNIGSFLAVSSSVLLPPVLQ